MTADPLVAAPSGGPPDTMSGVRIAEDIELIAQRVRGGDWIDGTLGVRDVLVSGDMGYDGFVPWSDSAEGNARRFADLAAERTVVTRPGQICWFDTGPAAAEELIRLAA